MESLLREQFGLKGGSESLSRGGVRLQMAVASPRLCGGRSSVCSCVSDIRLRLAGRERETAASGETEELLYEVGDVYFSCFLSLVITWRNICLSITPVSVSPSVPRLQSLECPGSSLQSSRSLDTLTDLRVQRLEAELEGVWHEARGACQREAELKAELQHLQEEIRQEKEQQELDVECEHCSVEWIKKAGDEQVNLALAYTELLEELSRILLRHGPASPPSDPAPPPPHLMRSHFQSRRSYSDMADPSVSPNLIHNPISTLPKRRTTSHTHLRPISSGPRPSSAHGALEFSFPLPDSTPAPLTTPPQSSEDEDDDLRSGISGRSQRVSVPALSLYIRPDSHESMAEPSADPDRGMHNEKQTSDNNTESSRITSKEKTSTETPLSGTSLDSEDTGAISSRSLSEREDSEITSSVDETPSLSTLNGGVALSTGEAQTSVRSMLDAEADGALPHSDDVASVEAGQAAVTMPPSALPSVQEHYYVKWITWKGEKTPIITQSENGPCPLLAIMNILFLRWKRFIWKRSDQVHYNKAAVLENLSSPADQSEPMLRVVGECVLSIKPRENAKGMELNFQQNMSDAMAVLPKLSTGLDVNVRFTGVADFEYTPECIVFDLLNIALYHGWLVDPQSPETASAVGKLSYNQLVEKIIVYKHSSDSNRVSEGLIAEQFLESTATQLTYHGLCELNTTAKEGELCVFFRNNHFSTLIKHKGHLYLLVTDQGFLQENTLVWESLHNVEGDGNFCDSEFRLCPPSQKSVSRPPTQQQIDQDYLVAMSLQQSQGEAPGALSDLELATRLQQEEYEQPQQPPRSTAEQHHYSTKSRGPSPFGHAMTVSNVKLLRAMLQRDLKTCTGRSSNAASACPTPRHGTQWLWLSGGFKNEPVLSKENSFKGNCSLCE
ncbi:Ubiquitin carboxyl-terminal hydrolase MINDY-1 [Bagarius yarrelli]|uniref:Ubiquitin carboxyl-terminal hydrolase MINDY-1 n=1 Tax=Bagarius yarrelli TaxID=175774 RepID=A0A556VAP6_BAGYA|nr:Ubiquitin carboxyl-terminal hydrolase MINDY-1 [Bagarius yarrelli]